MHRLSVHRDISCTDELSSLTIGQKTEPGIAGQLTETSIGQAILKWLDIRAQTVGPVPNF